MAIFELEANGKTYEIDAPDQATALSAFQKSQPAQAAAESPSVMADVAKSGGVGVGRGLIGLAGLPSDAAALLSTGVDKYLANPINRALGLNETDRSGPGLLGSQSIQKGVESVTGDFYKPKTTAGEYAQTVGEFAPAALGGPGGILRRVGAQVLAPALASETAGQITKGTDAEPYARFAGAIAGPGIVTAGRRLATPFPASAERAAMTSALEGEGVQLTAGQKTGSRPLQWLESTAGDMPLSGGKARSVMDTQGEQFTSAALKRVGEDALRATPQVIDSAFKRVGGEFDALAARNQVVADQQLLSEARTIAQDYTNLVSKPNQAPVVTNYIREIANAVQKNNGTLPGATYQSLRSRMQKDVGKLGSNAEAQDAVRSLREALDDAMERSLTAAGKSADVEAWKNARNQYRNLQVIQKAANGAGENAAMGLISPSALRNATVNQSQRAYARGQGDFAELARAGEATMKPLPNSGTAPRAYAMALPAILTSVLTGGLDAGALAAAATAAPGIVGRGVLSKPVQRYLGNQAVMPPSQLDARLRQLMLAGPAAVQASYPSR